MAGILGSGQDAKPPWKPSKVGPWHVESSFDIHVAIGEEFVARGHAMASRMLTWSPRGRRHDAVRGQR